MVAVYFNLLEQGVGELGAENYYADGERAAEIAIRMREKHGYHNVWGLFGPSLEPQLFGAAPGEEFSHFNSLEKLRVPDLLGCEPCLEETLRSLRLLRRELGGRYPICARVTGSMTMPSMLIGIEKWMELLFLGPTHLRDDLLQKCSGLVNKQIALYREHGADLIVYSDPFGSTDMVTSGVFRELSLPWILRDLQPVGVRGILYSCGSSRLGSRLSEVHQATGLSAYQLSSLDELAATRASVGISPLCLGTINYFKLVRGSREQIREEVRRVMQEGVLSGGNFAVSTSVMPLSISDSSIRDLVDAVSEFSEDLSFVNPCAYELDGLATFATLG